MENGGIRQSQTVAKPIILRCRINSDLAMRGYPKRGYRAVPRDGLRRRKAVQCAAGAEFAYLLRAGFRGVSKSWMTYLNWMSRF
jgi:hypothetical protein